MGEADNPANTENQEDFGFEERMRELLAEDAYAVRPSPAPYPAIRRGDWPSGGGARR